MRARVIFELRLSDLLEAVCIINLYHKVFKDGVLYSFNTLPSDPSKHAGFGFLLKHIS